MPGAVVGTAHSVVNQVWSRLAKRMREPGDLTSNKQNRKTNRIMDYGYGDGA